MTYKQDLQKLLDFATIHKVTIILDYTKEPDATAECRYWESKIIVYMDYISSTKSLIVTLLHELCHILSYQIDSKAMDGYGTSNYRDYLIEKRDIRHMLTLSRAVGLQRTPEAYIRAWMDYDVWSYWYQWMYNKEPSNRERQSMKLLLKSRYKLAWCLRH